MQLKKTYKGVNPEMLRDEIRALVEKLGVTVSETKSQTYPLPSGATQSRITMLFKIEEGECGSAHIIGSPEGEMKMLLDLDENLITGKKASAVQENLEFILGSYELKW